MLRTDRQQANTQMLENKDTSYTYEGQLSTDKDDRKLGHILGHMLRISGLGWNLKSIPAQTGNGIRINFKSRPHRKWNY